MPDRKGIAIGLRSAMLAIVLVALIVAVVLQGRSAVIQARRISELERRSRLLQQQNMQLATGFALGQQGRGRDLVAMQREVESLRRGVEALKRGVGADEESAAAAPTPEGEWVPESVTVNGGLISFGEEAAKNRLILQGNTYRFESNGKPRENPISFDGSRSPATFDMPITEGKFRGQTYHGIYKIEGDRLTLCNGAPDAPRPKAFESPVGSNVRLIVARRKTAP